MGHTLRAGENPLAYEKISRLVRKFAVPSIIAMLVTALYNIVDQIFIGQGVGMLGNAATNVAFPLTAICIASALLLGVGGVSNFNLQLGAGNNEKAAHFLGNTIMMLFLTGTVLMIIVRTFLKPLMLLFGATEQILPYAMEYAGITSYGFPFLILSNGMCNQIRGDGSPRYSMFCMLIGAVINTVLDPVFIFGFDMGIKGAALATVISQIISCIIAVAYIPKFKTVKLKRSMFVLDAKIAGAIISLGAASFFNHIAMMIVQVVMNNTLTYYGAMSSYGSEIPLACVGIISKVNMIFFSVAVGLSQGCQPIIGFNYGAKNYARVKQTLKLAMFTATVILTCSEVFFQLFPRQIVSIFGEGSDEYFRFAERFFRIYVSMFFINGIQPVVSNFFSSIGKAYKGIIMSLTRQVIFLLPLLIVLPMAMGIDGVMYAGPIADFAAAMLTGFLVLREIKTMNRLEAEKNAAGL
ncbi:MAG: MATE family efflux transporter [Oscillospiraceae bacterium]|nr:MATE family efflux transporter [Oscillospiraceae bacterium]